MTESLSLHLKKAVKANVSGLDIVHGELKNLMLATETKLLEPLSDVLYAYHEGVLDAYVNVYQLTYNLAFEIGETLDTNGIV